MNKLLKFHTAAAAISLAEAAEPREHLQILRTAPRTAATVRTALGNGPSRAQPQAERRSVRGTRRSDAHSTDEPQRPNHITSAHAER